MSGPTELPYQSIQLDFGGRLIVGQQTVREQLTNVLNSNRLSHAYLFAGPPGVGKKALALAFAEAVNGIDHFTDLQGTAFSKKSNWSTHPDIHFFMPLPGSEPDITELTARNTLLAADPYDIVDFNNRPSLGSDDDSGNKNAFYAIEYFRSGIRPVAYLKPNEGYRKVIIITEIERMKKESSNAFLKLLEEPPPNVMFILTTENINALLPTIISRCQVLRCPPLTQEEIYDGLVKRDHIQESDAGFLSRIASGNYSITRFYDINRLQTSRDEVVSFLRASYAMDPIQIINFSTSWNKDLNTQAQIGILNLIEVFIRDISVYRQTGEANLLTNSDQVNVISKFCESLVNAKLDEMLDLIHINRQSLRQNVSPRLLFTVIANRFAYLMRGMDTPVEANNDWKHLPALEIN